MKTPRGWAAVDKTKHEMIGRRVHWIGEPTKGTITDVTTAHGGYARFIVRWDDGAPDWWGNVVAPGASGLVVEE